MEFGAIFEIMKKKRNINFNKSFLKATIRYVYSINQFDKSIRLVRNPLDWAARRNAVSSSNPHRAAKLALRTQEIDGKSSWKEDAWGVPRRWGENPRLRGPAHPLSDSFYHWFLAF